MSNQRVVVLGAGIAGLSTANLLLQQEKGFKVHIVAKHFPGDLSGEYTSPWAGAHWRSHATKDDTRQQEFDRITYNHLWKLAKAPQNKTGIMIIDEFEYWERFPQDFSDPWFKTLCHEYRHLRKEELPTGIEFGITYKSISINPLTYLSYLLNNFTSLGGTTQRVNLLSHLNECLESETDIVINCSGIHARTLGGVEDPNVYAARGQTVIVQLPRSYMNWAFFKRAANGGEVTYAIPHDDGEVILGGTYDEHKYSTDIDYNTAKGIIQRCLATRPDILPNDQTQLTIKRHGVGLRPCRKGGVRIEAEWTISKKFGKRILICHNYGHGGSGFESSHGTAQHTIKVLKEALQGRPNFQLQISKL
ncbi:15604_t:CDS:10 [Funneliformis mosseae]|uniref:15604_t:CDS:1 n=1 Tax=Funneliformis mosseae TaxID=27381 RepID=A0A9N9GSU1_FUNMO|nr:15604_t:CDS:10 [Funneliformis mosseae]